MTSEARRCTTVNHRLGSRAMRRLLPLLVLVAAVTPATASADLPTFKTTKVDPGKSLAGVKIGASKASALKAWGKKCRTARNQCVYEAKGDTIQSKGAGVIFFTAGKVSAVSFKAPTKNPFRAPYTKLKTSKGVGIGSTRDQLRAAYPDARTANQGLYVEVYTGSMMTQFTVGEGRTTNIFIGPKPF